MRRHATARFYRRYLFLFSFITNTMKTIVNVLTMYLLSTTISAIGQVPYCRSFHPDLAPTTYHACFEIMRFFRSPQHAKLPFTFSRKADAGYLVPAQWLRGNCILHIDVNSDDDQETTTFEMISIAASQLAWSCVVPPPHLGGTVYVGPKSVMNVTIFGAHLPLTLRLPIAKGILKNSSKVNDSRY